VNVSIHYTIKQIAKIINGKWINKNTHIPDPAYLSLDSRKIIFPEKTIFFAISTRHRSAAVYINELYKKGVKNFVCDDANIDIKTLPDANVIIVQNTITALQKLAANHRQKFTDHISVIGITGSNGKTIVKEWLNILLEKEFSIVRSPKSFNSQIGVPLSVLNMNETHQLGIFEAGISLPSEMKNLQKIIQPEIAIVTNIGNAHDEGFKNRRQKIQEKLILGKEAQYLVYPFDDADIRNEVRFLKEKNKALEIFSWGKKEGAILHIKSIKKSEASATIISVYKKKIFSFSIPFTDDASIENAITCCCVLHILGKTGKKIFNSFSMLYPIAMRLELRQGVNHSTIINDSYSNDISSLNIAINFLNQQKQHTIHTIILSDILQSGRAPKELYAEVASLLKQNNIEKLYGIGTDIYSQQKEFDYLKNKFFFKTTEAFLQSVSDHDFRDETILIKGARIFEFEKITTFLEQKVHQTRLLINLNALVFNLKKYKEKLRPGTKIMAMVKAFSYGSGSFEIASVLQYNKVDYLAVAYADEGVELRKAGISLPIMVMNVDSSAFESIINYDLEPEIFSFSLLNDFLNFIKSSKKVGLPVHIKIDTGMHRLGFLEEQTDDLCKIISGNKLLEIKSIFSHLAASEDEKEDEFTLHQFTVFERCCKKIESVVSYPIDKHISNTSAITRHPKLQLDMVRLGIGLYGIDSNKKMQAQLKNVSTLVTTISQIKKLKAGETVGYGRNAKLEKESLIAVVRIGYADGFSRRLGNGNGKMWVKNKLAPVIGNVCMDMTMLDISDIKNVKEGDEVLVFGESLPLQKIAEWAQTIPYEIMTGISQRVKRIYLEE
jgi:alanine racemase